MTLTALLAKHKFDTTPVFDGKLYRFPRHGSKPSAWIRCDVVSGVKCARFGDWATSEDYTWSDTEAFSDDPIKMKAFEEEMQKARHTHDQEKLARQLKAKAEAKDYFTHAISRGTTPYLERKLLSDLFGAKIDPEVTSTLLVPLYDFAPDTTLDIWSYQKIAGNGEKQFLSGGRIKGCFHPIGDLNGSARALYVCEGFATGASLHLATGQPTVCAMFASNLAPVSKALRERFPSIPIVICGDDDRFATKPDHEGRRIPFNPGREAAEKASQAIPNARAVFPVFDEKAGEKDTDFNDVHRLYGIKEASRQVEEQLGPEEEPKDAGGGVGSDQGLKKSFSEKLLADKVITHFSGTLLRQDKHLFRYDGVKWSELNSYQIDQIKNLINAIMGDKLDHKKTMSMFNTFFRYVPPVPEDVNLFAPNPFAANFRNGTLWLYPPKAPNTKSLVEFKPHRAEDYLINELPYDYDPALGAVNGEFEEMLVRVFEGDEDANEKRRAIAQMYGACLIAAYPHLFFLYGAPGTGKSTVMKIAARLVHKDNLCHVEPHEFHSFNMETMVGKLVNMDTDVTITKPINDSLIKKIEDRIPFRIKRKGIKDAYAPIPATHIFGGNDIPKTLEGTSKAHDRRWTFIGFNKVQITGKFNKYYAEQCFDRCPQGVLNFAIRGLLDLLESEGHFVNPASGKAKIEEWQMRSDAVGEFLVDLREGEVLDSNTQMRMVSEEKIERQRAWVMFLEWHRITRGVAPYLSRNDFYRQLINKGIQVKTIKGVRYFSGFTVVAGATSCH